MELDFSGLSESLKALSDPVRLRILRLLAEERLDRKLNVSSIAQELGISQPNVSHHIKILKSEGFVTCTKREGCSYYVVDGGRIETLFSSLKPAIFPEAER